MADELFNLNDFNSIQLKIELTNTTRNQQIVNPKVKISIVEFMDQGVVLEVPPGAAEVGHYMSLSIEWKDSAGKPGLFHSGGKVIEAEKSRIAIELTQFEQAEWEAFQGLYAQRQDDILKFFAAVRGE